MIIQNKSKTPIEEVREELSKMVPQFKMALPGNITADKFMRVCMTAIQNSPDLLSCDRASLYSAAMKSAADGLIPDGREAALIKFNTKNGPKVQYMPMIQGILKRCRQSGELGSINALIVYETEEFSYWVDETGEHFKHTPSLEVEKGKIKFTYAYALTKDGDLFFEKMDEKQMNDVRNVSKSKDSGPWSGAFADEMRKKTVLRRLSKRLAMSSDVQNMIDSVDEYYNFKNAKEAQRLDKLAQLNHLLSGKEAHPAQSKEAKLEEMKPIDISPDFEAAVHETQDPRDLA